MVGRARKQSRKSRKRIWVPGHYAYRTINGRKVRYWVPGYYGYV